ncbi:MAG: hypothetical protein ACPLQO_04980 [Desulfotomaculales bacterium]
MIRSRSGRRVFLFCRREELYRRLKELSEKEGGAVIIPVREG